MELSRGQQRLLFVIVVLLLAGLGIYLVGTGHHGAAAAPGASPSASSAGPAPATSAPTIQPGTAAAIPSGGTDIYQWLPFTQQDLGEAARTTVAFAAVYETWTYTEPAAAYIAKMASLVTPDLAASLQNTYQVPVVAAQRTSQKQISTSSGGIASLRSFGPGSITFVVDIAQQLATTTGTTNKTTQYAVTLVSSGGGWQVNDIELAGAGNH